MKTITTVALATILLTIGTAVQAEDVLLTTEKPFRVAIGGYNPRGTSFRNTIGTTLPLISLSYDASKSTSEKPTIYSVYFDYAQNKRNGNNNSVSGFGIALRQLTTPPVTKERVFVGAGLGTYNIRVGSSNSKIGGKVFVGYEQNNGFFTELTYHVINKVHGTDASAASLSIGRRF
jgi:hypothetical protein